ncbi:hypothetical protein SBV1_880002 [Verrucomicrobia bacterium]|nr:hypothetical protein SBV1_880002 [Verrucomicrobiota bacterium]
MVVEPADQGLAALAIAQALVKLFAHVVRQAGDFSVAGGSFVQFRFHIIIYFIFPALCQRR